MAHMIDSLAYTGETPWHGLGRVLPKHATVEDMIREGGLDWDVVECPLFADLRGIPALGQRGIKLDDRKALVRKDTGTVLADVGNDYGVVPYREAFSIAAAACGPDALAEVGGSLDDGRRAFILLRMPSLDVAGDEISTFLLCYAGHDGRTPVACRFTPVRVVCQNTLTAAIGAKDSTELRIRHTSNALDRVKAAADMIAAAREYFGTFHKRALALTKQRLDAATAGDITIRLFPPYMSNGRRIIPAMGQKVISLFTRQAYQATDQHIAGTAWGYYNALTAALDHNGRNTGSEARMARTVSGTHDALRGKALELLAA